jgi:hypothetical protein
MGKGSVVVSLLAVWMNWSNRAGNRRRKISGSKKYSRRLPAAGRAGEG